MPCGASQTISTNLTQAMVCQMLRFVMLFGKLEHLADEPCFANDHLPQSQGGISKDAKQVL